MYHAHELISCALSQVTCLTSEGPVGRMSCQLRSFVALSLLHTRLLRELYADKFEGTTARGMEPMTADDPLDFYDFVEAMVRCLTL